MFFISTYVATPFAFWFVRIIVFYSYYTGTVAIVGIASEEYCRYLINKNNVPDVDKQVSIKKIFKSAVSRSQKVMMYFFIINLQIR